MNDLVARFPLDQRMTTIEAAEYLQRSRQTLERWRREGVGPRFYRATDARLKHANLTAVFYMISDLDDFIAATSSTGK